MDFLGNEANRFGSAGFSDERDAARAGMFEQKPGSLLVGFVGERPLFYDGDGGLLLTAGARGGKLKDILSYNLCAGIHTDSMLVLDMKGELAAISQDQTPDNKHCIYWNPADLHDNLPQMRINPVDYLRIGSPSLISDVKVLCQNLIPPTVGRGSDFFEGRAREFLEAIILTLVRMHGTLTLGQLYSAVNLIPGGGDKWLDFAFEMNQAGFEISARIEEEIANARHESSGSGYQGILGELFKALSCLSDPTLLESVSPPFDYSMEQFCDGHPTQLYIMPPAEFIEAWAPVIKAIFVAGMIYKARKPSAPRQTWILDECAQLGGFPLVTQLFTYGAGIGIRPWAVFQSLDQMDALGPKARNIITSSAQVRSFFTIRDIDTATTVSRMLGVQTLEYNDEGAQARARHAKHRAVQSLLNGGDPFMAGLDVSHHRREAERRTKQQRLLRTPDEVLRTPKDKQYIFLDDLPFPLYADRKAYFEQEFMAGRYHPNPHHPTGDKVCVKTRKGHEWLRVLHEPVPPQFADYPQYRDGMWSRIVKYRLTNRTPP